MHVDVPTNTLHFELPGKQQQIVTADLLFGADGAFSALRDSYTRLTRVNCDQHYLEYGYKELCIVPGKNGEWLMEKNALHIWPRGNYMLIALPNTDGTFTCTLFMPFEGEVSFEKLKTEQDVTAFFDKQFPDAKALMPGLLEDFFTNPTEKTMHRLGFPGSIRGSFQGTARTFQQSSQSTPWLILAALIAIYIVLGILYESYVHPVTILSTLPSPAGAGALLALILFHVEFTIMALMGVILLIGIVKKNAIMMIDFALDRERKEGKSPDEAILMPERHGFWSQAHKVDVPAGAPAACASAAVKVVRPRDIKIGGKRRPLLHQRQGASHLFQIGLRRATGVQKVDLNLGLLGCRRSRGRR